MNKFSEELFNRICQEISLSSKGLIQVCKENDLSAVSFYAWIKEDENLLNRYTHAREMQADFMADEIISISNGEQKDDTPFVGKNFIDSV